MSYIVEIYCMDPTNISYILNRIASYIEDNDQPSRTLVIGTLDYLNRKLSADVKMFTRPEFQSTMKSLEELIDRLGKVISSLNPQDPSRLEIEGVMDELNQSKGQIENSYDSLNIQV